MRPVGLILVVLALCAVGSLANLYPGKSFTYEFETGLRAHHYDGSLISEMDARGEVEVNFFAAGKATLRVTRLGVLAKNTDKDRVSDLNPQQYTMVFDFSEGIVSNVEWIPDNTPLSFKNLHRSLASTLQLPSNPENAKYTLTDTNGRCSVDVTVNGDLATKKLDSNNCEIANGKPESDLNEFRRLVTTSYELSPEAGFIVKATTHHLVVNKLSELAEEGAVSEATSTLTLKSISIAPANPPRFSGKRSATFAPTGADSMFHEDDTAPTQADYEHAAQAFSEGEGDSKLRTFSTRVARTLGHDAEETHAKVLREAGKRSKRSVTDVTVEFASMLAQINVKVASKEKVNVVAEGKALAKVIASSEQSYDLVREALLTPAHSEESHRALIVALTTVGTVNAQSVVSDTLKSDQFRQVDKISIIYALNNFEHPAALWFTEWIDFLGDDSAAASFDGPLLINQVTKLIVRRNQADEIAAFKAQFELLLQSQQEYNVALALQGLMTIEPKAQSLRFIQQLKTEQRPFVRINLAHAIATINTRKSIDAVKEYALTETVEENIVKALQLLKTILQDGFDAFVAEHEVTASDQFRAALALYRQTPPQSQAREDAQGSNKKRWASIPPELDTDYPPGSTFHNKAPGFDYGFSDGVRYIDIAAGVTFVNEINVEAPWFGPVSYQLNVNNRAYLRLTIFGYALSIWDSWFQLVLQRNPSGDEYFTQTNQIKQYNYNDLILANIISPAVTSRTTWGANSPAVTLTALTSPSGVVATRHVWQSFSQYYNTVTNQTVTTTCDFICALKASQDGSALMPFHYVIDSQGTIYQGQAYKPNTNPAVPNLATVNSGSTQIVIGIFLDGHNDTSAPDPISQAATDSYVALTSFLAYRYLTSTALASAVDTTVFGAGIINTITTFRNDQTSVLLFDGKSLALFNHPGAFLSNTPCTYVNKDPTNSASLESSDLIYKMDGIPASGSSLHATGVTGITTFNIVSSGGSTGDIRIDASTFNSIRARSLHPTRIVTSALRRLSKTTGYLDKNSYGLDIMTSPTSGYPIMTVEEDGCWKRALTTDINPYVIYQNGYTIGVEGLGVGITFRVIAEGQVAVDVAACYERRYAEVAFTPWIQIGVDLEGSASALVVRGGIIASLNLCRVEFRPRIISDYRSPTSSPAGFCTKGDFWFQLGNGQIDAYVQFWEISCSSWKLWECSSGWGSQHRRSIASWGGYTFEIPLWDSCNPSPVATARSTTVYALEDNGLSGNLATYLARSGSDTWETDVFQVVTTGAGIQGVNLNQDTGTFTVTFVHNFKGSTYFQWKYISYGAPATSNVATFVIQVEAVADGVSFHFLEPGVDEVIHLYEDHSAPFRFQYEVLDDTEYQQFQLIGVPVGWNLTVDDISMTSDGSDLFIPPANTRVQIWIAPPKDLNRYNIPGASSYPARAHLTFRAQSIEESNSDTWTQTFNVYIDVVETQDPISCSAAPQVLATTQVVTLPDIICSDVDINDEAGHPHSEDYRVKVTLEVLRLDFAEYGVGDAVGQGNLNLTSRNGLTFLEGNGLGEYRTVFTGNWADVWESLELITFTELRLFWGAVIRVTVNDLGHYGADYANRPSNAPTYSYGSEQLLVNYGESSSQLTITIAPQEDPTLNSGKLVVVTNSTEPCATIYSALDPQDASGVKVCISQLIELKPCPGRWYGYLSGRGYNGEHDPFWKHSKKDTVTTEGSQKRSGPVNRPRLIDDGTPYHTDAEAGIFYPYDYLVDFEASPNSTIEIRLDNLRSTEEVWFLARWRYDPQFRDFDYFQRITAHPNGGGSAVIVIPEGAILRDAILNIGVVSRGNASYDIRVTYTGQRDFWMRPCCFGKDYNVRRVGHKWTGPWEGFRQWHWTSPTRIVTPGNVHTSVTFKSDLFPGQNKNTMLTFTIDLYERSYELWNGDELVQISDGDVKYSFKIEDWPFLTPYNELQLVLEVTTPGLQHEYDVIHGEYNETAEDGSLRRVDSFFSTGYNTTVAHTFAQTALYDGVNKPISAWITEDKFVHLFFHYFDKSLEYDPVVSLVYDTRLEKTVDGGWEVHSSSTTVAAIIGSVVGVLAVVALAVLSVLYVRKRGLPHWAARLGHSSAAQPQ